MSTSHEGLAAPPAGLGLLVLVASVAVRAAALERVDAAYMLWCGLLQDWKASVGWSLALWALPLALLREAATAAALVHLVIDFGLQATAGIRMHSDAWALVVKEMEGWQHLTPEKALARFAVVAGDGVADGGEGDLAYFEPTYLKEFAAALPKNPLGLGRLSRDRMPEHLR